MKIAINTRFLLSNYLEGYGNFLHEILKRLVHAYPEHEFIFLFDRPFDKRFIAAPNVTGIVVSPPARHPLLWKWWYDVKIPAVLKKIKADVFVSCDGFCSLTTRVPQCLVIHDLAFLHYPSFIRRSHSFFYKRYTPRFIRKAASLATVSEFSKKDILSFYPIDPQRVHVIYNAVKDSFRPVTDQEKEITRQQFTEGKNYFIYAGAIHPRKNLMNLLKAFSVFKKRQQSDWKLVITGRAAWKYQNVLDSLKNYKYRHDVVLTGYVSEEQLVLLIGAAYALVYPSLWEGFGVPVLEAMRCGVPVVTSAHSAMQEIAGEAALYANPEDHTDIADKLMLLYKDETLRARLIEKGTQQERQYSWERSARLFWQSILEASEHR